MPFLSIVLCGRNDDHGMRFADRFYAALAYNRANLEAMGVDHEVVFVDWAYDPSRELFARMLRRRFPFLRCIAVDREFQERRKTNPRLAFMEFWAKNVGVRRARGEFVLTTNSDVFFSRALVSWLKRGRLVEDVCYRAIRVDVRLEVGCENVGHALLESPLAHSTVNVLQPPYAMNASGDFILLGRRTWDKIGGFNEGLTHSKVHLDGNLCVNVVKKHGLPIEVVGKVWHLEHEKSLNLSHHLYGKRNELAPYGPDWDYTQTYENPPGWGLAEHAGRTSEDGILMIDWRAS